MIIRKDLKSKKGAEIQKMLGSSADIIQFHIKEKKTISGDGDFPDTYYIKEIDGNKYVVPRENIFNLLKEDKTYFLLCIGKIVIGIDSEYKD